MSTNNEEVAKETVATWVFLGVSAAILLVALLGAAWALWWGGLQSYELLIIYVVIGIIGAATLVIPGTQEVAKLVLSEIAKRASISSCLLVTTILAGTLALCEFPHIKPNWQTQPEQMLTIGQETAQSGVSKARGGLTKAGDFATLLWTGTKPVRKTTVIRTLSSKTPSLRKIVTTPKPKQQGGRRPIWSLITVVLGLTTAAMFKFAPPKPATAEKSSGNAKGDKS